MFRHRQGASVQIRPAPAHRGEQLFPNGIEHHRHDHIARLLEADRDTEHRIAVGEVGRAVQRIDEKTPFLVPLGESGLLGHDRNPGAPPLQDAEDGLLGLGVRLSHQVQLTLVANAQIDTGRVVPAEYAAGGQRRLDRRRELLRELHADRRIIPASSTPWSRRIAPGEFSRTGLTGALDECAPRSV